MRRLWVGGVAPSPQIPRFFRLPRRVTKNCLAISADARAVARTEMNLISTTADCAFPVIAASQMRRLDTNGRLKKVAAGCRDERRPGRTLQTSWSRQVRRPCGGPWPCGRPDERASPSCGGRCRNAWKQSAPSSTCGPASLSSSQSLPLLFSLSLSQVLVLPKKRITTTCNEQNVGQVLTRP